jgi:hypothetical protein
MIKDGIKSRIIIPKLESNGFICYIGDIWFFFGSNIEPKDMNVDLLVNEIKCVLDDWYEDACNGDYECRADYLYCYDCLCINI